MAFHKRSWSTIKALCLISAIRCTSWFPLNWSQAIGRALGRFLVMINNGNIRVARYNLERCLPHWDIAQRERCARESLQHLGMTVMEAGLAMCWTREKTRHWMKPTIGEQHLIELWQQKRGVILVMPHTGNWELLPQALTAQAPLCALYREADNVMLDKFIRDGRVRNQVEMAAANQSGVKQLLTNLKAGYTLIVLADHEPSKGTGVFVPYFGHTAYTGTLVPKLARKTGAAIVMCAVERLPQSQGFQLRLIPGPDLANQADAEQGAAQLNDALANLIMHAPEQYTWNYKRFRRVPAGQVKNPYRALK